MLQGESYGPFSVLKDGSLLIMSAIVDDSGEYTCQALSTAGAALSKAKLTVKGWMLFLLLLLSYYITLFINTIIIIII